VLEKGVVVGRIFKAQVAPEGRPGCGQAVTTATTSNARHRAMSRRASRRWRRSPRAGDGSTECHHDR
jgi:hypothetical protein